MRDFLHDSKYCKNMGSVVIIAQHATDIVTDIISNLHVHTNSFTKWKKTIKSMTVPFAWLMLFTMQWCGIPEIAKWKSQWKYVSKLQNSSLHVSLLIGAWTNKYCDTHEIRNICICVHNSTRNKTTTCSEQVSLQIQSKHIFFFPLKCSPKWEHKVKTARTLRTYYSTCSSVTQNLDYTSRQLWTYSRRTLIMQTRNAEAKMGFTHCY